MSSADLSFVTWPLSRHVICLILVVMITSGHVIRHFQSWARDEEIHFPYERIGPGGRDYFRPRGPLLLSWVYVYWCYFLHLPFLKGGLSLLMLDSADYIRDHFKFFICFGHMILVPVMWSWALVMWPLLRSRDLWSMMTHWSQLVMGPFYLVAMGFSTRCLPRVSHVIFGHNLHTLPGYCPACFWTHVISGSLYHWSSQRGLEPKWSGDLPCSNQRPLNPGGLIGFSLLVLFLCSL